LLFGVGEDHLNCAPPLADTKNGRAILYLWKIKEDDPYVVVNKTGFVASRRFGRDSFASRSRLGEKGQGVGARSQGFLHGKARAAYKGGVVRTFNDADE
jgi:hypothetical protein